MNSAVLFLVFNRPNTTRKVFEAIRNAQPPRLYIAADGPRANRLGESDRCRDVQQIVSVIDWPCEVKTLFREENLGCKRAVSQGITWFFESEEEGIILEDDCLPHMHFFQYCDELLERYRNDERIGVISGSPIFSEKPQNEALTNDYFFSRHFSIWGWATWRRAWRDYDESMSDWPQVRAVLLETYSNKRYRKSVDRLFASVFAGKIDTWDYQFVYANLKAGRVAVVPKIRLIENIGFGDDATHTKSKHSSIARLACIDNKNLRFPLREAGHKIRNISYERRLESFSTRSRFMRAVEFGVNFFTLHWKRRGRES